MAPLIIYFNVVLCFMLYVFLFNVLPAKHAHEDGKGLPAHLPTGTGAQPALVQWAPTSKVGRGRKGPARQAPPAAKVMGGGRTG